MNATATATITDAFTYYAGLLRNERDGWLSEIQRAAKGPRALVAHGWVVVDSDLNSAIALHGTRLQPTWVLPGLVGVSAWDRKQAEQVAAAFGDDWQVVRDRDVPALRVQRIDQLLASWPC